VHSTNDFGNKVFKIVLVHFLEVVVINLAFDVLIALSSSIFLKIFLSSSTLRGLDAGLSMPRTLVKNIYPQVVDSPEELEAFQPLPRDVFFLSISNMY
jgi:hypothetical protein